MLIFDSMSRAHSAMPNINSNRIKIPYLFIGDKSIIPNCQNLSTKNVVTNKISRIKNLLTNSRVCDTINSY